MKTNNSVNEKQQLNILRVTKHRLNKQDVPDYKRLKRICALLSKQELKAYVDKAKQAYQSLLSENNTTTSKKIME